MSVTVVLRRVARPGQEEAVVRAMVEALSRDHDPRRPQATIFQSAVDFTASLYVAQWTSREAYETRERGAPSQLDRLCSRVERRFYQPYATFERLYEPGPILVCAEFQVPRAALETVMAYVTERHRPILCALPGCVFSALHRDLDDPSRLFALHRWHSAEDLPAFHAAARGMGGALRDLGVHVEQFWAVQRGEIAADPTR